MHLSPVDAILAVATLSTPFLAEILVFVADLRASRRRNLLETTTRI